MKLYILCVKWINEQRAKLKYIHMEIICAIAIVLWLLATNKYHRELRNACVHIKGIKMHEWARTDDEVEN